MTVAVRAAVLREAGQPFVIEELTIEDPRPDEVLVRIAATGVCHTDAIVRDQWYPVPMPVVLGHEGAGVVEAVGSAVRKVVPGDHVVLSFDSCGRCTACGRGRPSYCVEAFDRSFGAARSDDTTALWCAAEAIHSHFFGQSSFATYSLATERSVVRVDTDVAIDALGALGCGVQTGAGGVLNALQCEPGSSLAIFGTGAVGLSAVMGAQVAGCTTVIGVDLKESRRQMAVELGATHVIDPEAGDIRDALLEASRGGVDYTLDTTGIPDVVRTAVDVLNVLGVCGIIGASPLNAELCVDMNQIFFGRTVRGIIEGDSVPDIFIPRLIQLFESGRFPFDRLLQFYDLDDINQALEDSEAGAAIKPMIRMPRDTGK